MKTAPFSRLAAPALALLLLLGLAYFALPVPPLCAADTTAAAAAASASTPEAPDLDELDRTRGQLVLDSESGTYQDGTDGQGNAFATWRWSMKTGRWGQYEARIRYGNSNPRTGIQLKIGDQVKKTYVPGTKEITFLESHGVGKVYLEPGEHEVFMLTGDLSKGPRFQLENLHFIPAAEGAEDITQGIDGVIELHAKDATTYSENMRYEPKPEKNCLGFWTEADDWAEWEFEVLNPGTFKVEVTQGCGGENGGSTVAVITEEDSLTFTVEDTGGFQNWKTRDIGAIEFDDPGKYKLAIKPLNKTGKAVMDIQKIVLTPVSDQ